MDRRTIPITPDTVVEQPFDIKLGTSVMAFPEGEALCTDAVSLTMITAQASTGQKFLVVIGVAEFDGRHLGLLSPLSPNEARNFAASLVKSANEIDAQAGLQ